MFQFQVLVHLPTTPFTAVAGIILCLSVKSVSIVFVPDAAQKSTLFKQSNDDLIQHLWLGDDRHKRRLGEIFMQDRDDSYTIRILSCREIQGLASLTCRKGHTFFFFWI